MNGLDRFRAEYERLAEEGYCDSWGGMESKRVLRQWLEADCPQDIGRFICFWANYIPDTREA